MTEVGNCVFLILRFCADIEEPNGSVIARWQDVQILEKRKARKKNGGNSHYPKGIRRGEGMKADMTTSHTLFN